MNQPDSVFKCICQKISTNHAKLNNSVQKYKRKRNTSAVGRFDFFWMIPDKNNLFFCGFEKMFTFVTPKKGVP
jgi:hypothetical protein